MKLINKYLLIILCIFTVTLTSCLEDIEPESETIETEGHDNSDIDDDFDTNSKDDLDLTNGIKINFSGDSINIENPYDGAGVAISYDNGKVTVRSTVTDKEINYILSGTASSGSVKIYSDYKFGLVLNGISLVSSNGPAINIQSGKKVTVTLIDGTSNRLVDSDTYTTTSDESMKAAFFSEGQLIFEGNGSLQVYGSHNHAICSDDYILVKSGTITIPRSENDGIHANDYIEIEGGTLNITSTGDGIDCEKGYIVVNSGTININVSGQGSKCIKSTGDMTLAGGIINLTTTGNAYYSTTDADIKSAAGAKCDANMIISGNCNLTINSSGSGGKGINVDGTLTFDGGTINVTTSGALFKYGKDDAAAKAIKSDGNLTVNTGQINIKTSKEEAEGMESKATLTINGGTVEIEAYDDCINASKHIQINGGNIYCYSTTNDGIDSNGTLTVTGGVIVSAGASAPEEGFDCDNNRFTITGGILIGTGGATSSPTTSVCTQRSLIYRASLAANSIIHIESSSGEEALTFKLPKVSSTMLFSSPKLSANTNYSIYTGGSISGSNNFYGFYSDATYTKGSIATTFTTSSMVTTIGTSSGGNGGRP